MRTRAERMGIKLTVAAVLLASILIAAQVSAAPGPWPSKKGELCWVATSTIPDPDEYSFVRAQVTNMGGDHYLFHGHAYRVAGLNDLTKINDLQALGGNLEFDPDNDAWIGQITKTEYIEGWLEVYTGLINLEAATLDGEIEGVISTCVTPGPTTTCETLNTGPIDLTYITCP